MNTENLKIGQVFKDHKELCEFLGEEFKIGGSLKIQMKDFERYFKYHKIEKSRKIVIDEIYLIPIEKEKRKKYNIENKNIIKNSYDLSGEYGIVYIYKIEIKVKNSSSCKKAYFDLEDYDKIKNHIWNKNNKGYIFTYNRDTKKILLMHNLIIPRTKEEILNNITIDHINRNKYDNRKEKLRKATKSLQSFNRNKDNKNKSVKTQGVIKCKNGWNACISCNYEKIDLGTYKLKKDAIKARQEAELKYFGELVNR